MVVTPLASVGAELMIILFLHNMTPSQILEKKYQSFLRLTY
jgi:hypothetical protein